MTKKKNNYKPVNLSLKGKVKPVYLISISVLVFSIVFYFMYFYEGKCEWRNIQIFDNTEILTSYEIKQTSNKSSSTKYFHISRYSTKDGKYLSSAKVFGSSGQNEFIGTSQKYLWFLLTELCAYDPVENVTLKFEDLSKKILENNTLLIKKIVSIRFSSGHIRITGEEGDELLLQPDNFKLAKTYDTDSPAFDDYELSIREETKFSKNYVFTSFQDGVGFEYGAGYVRLFKPSTSMKSILQMVTENSEIIAVEQSEAGIKLNIKNELSETKNDTYQSESVQIPEIVTLGKNEFLNGRAIGINRDKFILLYQKEMSPSSPWFLCFFDLRWNKIATEIDLSKQGFNLKIGMDNDGHYVVDESNKKLILLQAGEEPMVVDL